MPPDVDIAGSEGGKPAKSARRLEPGAQVAGRYTIAELIRRGTVGEVYRANDSSNGHPVEIYVLDERLANNASFKNSVEAQLTRAAMIQHKNIAQVGSLSSHDALVYAVGEFVDGNTLAELIARKRKTDSTFSPKGAYNVIAHLCNALTHLHKQGGAHGMLHPGNVLVNKAGRVKLSELGLAASGSWKSPQAAPYAAPELLSGGAPTAGADMYSLGAILYELLTGGPPHKNSQPPSKLVPGLTPAVDHVVIKCVAPTPDKRFPDAKTLKKALQAAIDSAGKQSAQRAAAAPKRPSLAHQLTGDQQAKLQTAGRPSGQHAAAHDDTAEKWLISKGKLDFGPFNLQQIIQQIEANQILPGHVIIDSETAQRTPVEDHALLHDIVDKAKQRRDDMRRAQAEVTHAKTEKRRGATLYIVIAAGVLALGGGAYFVVDKMSAASDDSGGGSVAAIEEGQLQAKITFMSSGKKRRGKGRRGKGRRSGTSRGTSRGNSGGSTGRDEYDGPMDLGDVSEGSDASERLDDSEINPVISRHGGKLGRCLSKTGSRRAHIQFVIRGNGKVSYAKVNGQTGTPLAKCVSGVMKRMSFPTFNGPRTRAEFELSF